MCIIKKSIQRQFIFGNPKYELNEEQNDVVFPNENTAHAMYNFLSTHEIKVENNEAMFVKSSSSLLLNTVLK